jgi:hypothetical protein
MNDGKQPLEEVVSSVDFRQEDDHGDVCQELEKLSSGSHYTIFQRNICIARHVLRMKKKS